MLELKEAFKIRDERDKLLNLTQRYVEADNWADLTTAQQTEVKVYRQALRDIPQVEFVKPEVNSLTDITWPSKPDFMS